MATFLLLFLRQSAGWRKELRFKNMSIIRSQYLEIVFAEVNTVFCC